MERLASVGRTYLGGIDFLANIVEIDAFNAGAPSESTTCCATGTC